MWYKTPRTPGPGSPPTREATAIAPPTRRRARALHPDTIIGEALRLVRAEGLAAVTMRRVAERMDTAPMSLYRHVQDREALLIGMLDAVALGIVLPPVAGDARSEITSVLGAIHDALRRDAWAIPLIVTEGLAGPSILPVLERLFAALERTGLHARACMVAFKLLWQYAIGELMDTHPIGSDRSFARDMAMMADAARFPAFARAVEVFREGGASDHFTENLQRLLDGLLPPYTARGTGP
ncbi:GntR family transcriptional regulator [Pilimelia anulata]|uniref:GntR family transcriptional regulator n=1 Tax=Pilimelia anulata TaxID=53371 RepID=A0A8J3B6K4_9ACTN|nr:GntR family transcriptional regulator [Pilimelia anulata]